MLYKKKLNKMSMMLNMLMIMILLMMTKNILNYFEFFMLNMDNYQLNFLVKLFIIMFLIKFMSLLILDYMYTKKESMLFTKLLILFSNMMIIDLMSNLM